MAAADLISSFGDETNEENVEKSRNSQKDRSSDVKIEATNKKGTFTIHKQFYLFYLVLKYK